VCAGKAMRAFRAMRRAHDHGWIMHGLGRSLLGGFIYCAPLDAHLPAALTAANLVNSWDAVWHDSWKQHGSCYRPCPRRIFRSVRTGLRGRDPPASFFEDHGRIRPCSGVEEAFLKAKSRWSLMGVHRTCKSGLYTSKGPPCLSNAKGPCLADP